jgi:4'-phosphopantetheinyl transferase
MIATAAATSGGAMASLGDEIHVWRASLDQIGWPSPRGLPLDEQERAARMRRVGTAQRWVASRWALRGVLGHYLGRSSAQIPLQLGPHGKPELTRPDASLRFNLSHSGDIALIAVAREREIGIDVERVESGRNVLALAAHGLDEEAAATVREAAADDRIAVFHNAWACHEATVKCLGHGLGRRRPTDGVSVSELDVGPGYAAALATAGDQLPPVRQFAITAQLDCL